MELKIKLYGADCCPGCKSGAAKAEGVLASYGVKEYLK